LKAHLEELYILSSLSFLSVMHQTIFCLRPPLQTSNCINVPEKMISVNGSTPVWSTPSLWPALIPMLIVFAIYKLMIYPAFISPLSRIPNAHWSSPFFSTWILLVRYQNRENKELHAAHLEHGPVVRLGPNEICINNVDGGIRTIYGGGFEKGDWYSIFDNHGYVF
jgi:hypothetical protein